MCVFSREQKSNKAKRKEKKRQGKKINYETETEKTIATVQITAFFSLPFNTRWVHKTRWKQDSPFLQPNATSFVAN